MSAPKFTPKPWRLEAGRSIVTGSGSFYLAYGTHPKSGRPNFTSFVELDANAHLIASAPELYEALELALATIERLAVRHGPFCSADGTMDVVRAALAKARGGSEASR